MFQNVRLPHWAMMVLGLLAIIIPWLLAQEKSGLLVVPQWVIVGENGTILILAYLGFKAPSVDPNVNARAAMRYNANQLSKKVAPSSVFLMIGFWCCGCKNIEVPSGTVTSTIQTTVCVLATMSNDLFVKHEQWQAAVADTMITCGTDNDTINAVWDSHTKAEVLEGAVPRFMVPVVDGGTK